MKRWIILLAALWLALAGWALAEITSIEQLNHDGISVGTETGCAAWEVIREKLPAARLEPYNDKQLGYVDVAAGRLDAFIFERTQMELAIRNGVRGVHLLDEDLGDAIKVAVGLSPVSSIPDLENRINAFIAGLRADGTLQDMITRWVTEGREDLPEISLPKKPALHLRVGTSGIVPPYSYYVGTELRGFDIELANRFAAYLGADLEIRVYDYGAIVPAAISGDVDCIMANLNVTPERAEALPFSDTLYEIHIGVMVRGEAASVPSRLSAPSAPSAPERTFSHVGVQTGTNFDAMVSNAMPEARVDYYNNKADLVAALTGHKIDGFAVDEPVAKLLMAEDERLTYLPEPLDRYEFACVFPKSKAGEALRDKFDAFLEQLPEGTLDELARKWFGEDEAAKTMPDLGALTAENGTLSVATEATYAPFEYLNGTEVVGYDMELAAMFCQYAGYGMKIVDMNFDGILPAVLAGKCDFAAAGISVTPERQESVLFSKPTFSGGAMLVVLKEGAAPSGGGAGTLETLSHARIGVPTGSSFDLMVKKALPEAEISYYNNQSDLLMALSEGKIDAFPSDEPVIRYIMNQRSDVTYIPEYLETFEFAYCFPRTEGGQKLRDEMSAFLADMKAKGELEALSEKWFGVDESQKTLPDIKSLPADNGTLVMATDGDYMPFEYVRDGAVVGYDVDLAAQFCQARGYGLRVEVLNLDGVLPAVQSGKCQFGGSAITITPERAESMLFSEPNYTGGTVMVVRKAQKSAAAAVADAGEKPAEKSGIALSFEKTFIRENRWRLFVNGIVTTLIITLSSILTGTALGFLVFMLCRKGSRAANLITGFCLWLVQGMPMVVFLMILYYVIFGSVSINGIVVAVIGFTFTFGAAVFGLLKMGVGAVDPGQYEAACAMGYSDRQTFYKIILPQAIPHILPSYKGEIVGLIKATAVVGYIAVQDLTKVGDIVRSRTYEAFFPLIAVTVIYFALEGLVKLLLGRITVNCDPKRRKPADILKGVKTDDQN